MLIVEWRDIGYTSSTTCSFQAVFYDVTNEIEFKYDTGCKLTDDYSSTGFMDHTRTHGQHIRDASRYLSWTGSNPFTHNYRITTDGNASSVETFTQGAQRCKMLLKLSVEHQSASECIIVPAHTIGPDIRHNVTLTSIYLEDSISITSKSPSTETMLTIASESE